MASGEDGEVEPDDADLLDWLWDIPERPATGDRSDEPNPFAATPPLRWPGQDNRVGPASPPPGDQPTLAVDPVDPVETFDLRRRPQPDPVSGRSAGPSGFGLPTFPAAGGEPETAGHDYPSSLAPIFADQRPRRRLSGRSLGAAAAALVVIVVGVGVGYSLLGHVTPSKPPNVTFGTDSTGAQTTLAPAVPIFGDTTTSSTPTSTTGPTTTSSSVPAVAVGTTTTMTTVKPTTTTAPHTTTTVTRTTPLPTIVATVPQGTTTVPPSTTTTVAPTTTTATLLPPIP